MLQLVDAANKSRRMNHVRESTPAEARPFKTVFCEVYRCSPEKFARRLFWMSLHRRALPFAPFFLLVRPSFFRLDLQLMEEIGLADSHNEFMSAINGFRQDCQDKRRFVHDDLGLRISGRRLLAVIKKTKQKARETRHSA